jgi:hypothetical protein
MDDSGNSEVEFIRVKFHCERTGLFQLKTVSKELQLLQNIVQQMEALGAAPPLPDGLVSVCRVRAHLYRRPGPAQQLQQ